MLDAFINLILENLFYFWNIILILVTLHHPCPVCSLERSLEHGFSSILDY